MTTRDIRAHLRESGATRRWPGCGAAGRILSPAWPGNPLHPGVSLWAYAAELAADLLGPASPEPANARPWLTCDPRPGESRTEPGPQEPEPANTINCAWPSCTAGSDGGPGRFVPRSRVARTCPGSNHRQRCYADRQAAKQAARQAREASRADAVSQARMTAPGT